MIGRLSGILLEKNPPHLLLDCHGVGYEIDAPMSTFYQMPAIGEPLVLLTHLIVRADAHALYGFASAPERTVFRELLKISGVGARMALAVLSGLSIADLRRAVNAQNAAMLAGIPGIGKKTAARLLLELKGKFGDAPAGIAGGALTSAHGADILNALLALGYSEKEALAAIQAIPADSDVSDGIRLALKHLSKA
ncbi:Holliday junction ATP-dependent DNA helicase ruvA [Candidatus Glomeribacter gigasporarum BEG34]|uniref:Holliday junction branch migration complex subunit RuvA n=1 Tax=Candidatus Glomeribacter gigasporarum BEG34 TaxID=1070319 RepID=G2J7P0_9BURK|nr:Holliday junction branch migration protein RuvA [Candidatus Glomeribacter gigasporarum]CCD28785.1 Holliday junction ATP-dependent DNA helicase ruvA [Candidatus Glomeribacter gigasporarum BEG34]